jgi:outer membrane receptor protein involved in Fe transport
MLVQAARRSRNTRKNFQGVFVMHSTAVAKNSVLGTVAQIRVRGRTDARLLCGVILAALFAASVSAQQAQPTSAPELQEVVVTGSLIKRTDTETPSPVQIISDEDLRNSGYTNVSAVLRNLAANGQGTLAPGFTEAFAAGASGIALRAA